MKDLPKMIKWLGFNYNYRVKVLSDPIFDGESYTYDMKLLQKDFMWFNFKIKCVEKYN